jgi:hypothetical protein
MFNTFMMIRVEASKEWMMYRLGGCNQIIVSRAIFLILLGALNLAQIL